MAEGTPEIEVTHSSKEIPGPEPYLLVLPGPGFAPAIIGLNLAQEVSDEFRTKGERRTPKVIIPLTGGEAQRDMLLHEAQDPTRVIYSIELGEIINSLELPAGDFTGHLKNIVENADPANRRLQQLVNTEIRGRVLGTNEEVIVSGKDIIAAINVGARIGVNTDTLHMPQYYAFPELLSRIWERAEGFPEELLHQGVTYMREVEKGIRIAYIPLAGTLSHEYAGDLDEQPTIHANIPIRFTPPMAQPKLIPGVPQNLENASAFVNYSGTGGGEKANEVLIDALKLLGFDVYTQVKGKHAKQAHPYIQMAKGMEVSAGRAGWGTGWLVLQNNLLWVVLEAPPGTDDPEMTENNKTVAALGIGVVVNPENETAEEIAKKIQDALAAGREQVEKLGQDTIEEFGTMDGIAYAGKRIGQDLLQHPVKITPK